VKIRTATLGALAGRGYQFATEGMAAFSAPPLILQKVYGTSVDRKERTFFKKFRYFMPGAFDQSCKSRARNAHQLRCLGLVISLTISKPEGFILIQGKNQFIQLP
jgi:hypothetical protein